MEARVLTTPIEQFKRPVVAGLDYRIRPHQLVIYYHSNGGKDIDYDIIFEQPRGFKCLDEGDMVTYWESRLLVDNWLFEILGGGWLDREDAQGGFSSKALGFREFLITGVDDCISVLSNEEPIIVKRQNPVVNASLLLQSRPADLGAK
ncbi:hypothetical protein [Hymenobacter cellulosilyticus]|uniref:Uncharacterized protein n=1 Tax=Hymenobacter cellulosilyticus TaxID=2932248 RepID=A0A8T9QDL5_9BACT|nr:hypothetical protein [Hymenobacter cellulosilyticus]UOQ74501.1 hypothetical protein MUN79_11830 [Hymenobacter cellulosilyticus]